MECTSRARKTTLDESTYQAQHTKDLQLARMHRACVFNPPHVPRSSAEDHDEEHALRIAVHKHLTQGMPDGALRHLADSTPGRSFPDTLEHLIGIANAYANRRQEAREHLELALRMRLEAPRNQDQLERISSTYNGLAQVALYQGKHDRAWVLLNKALEFLPLSILTHGNRMHVAYVQHRRDREDVEGIARLESLHCLFESIDPQYDREEHHGTQWISALK